MGEVDSLRKAVDDERLLEGSDRGEGMATGTQIDGGMRVAGPGALPGMPSKSDSKSDVSDTGGSLPDVPSAPIIRSPNMSACDASLGELVLECVPPWLNFVDVLERQKPALSTIVFPVVFSGSATIVNVSVPP
jgi:hypothetical protein